MSEKKKAAQPGEVLDQTIYDQFEALQDYLEASFDRSRDSIIEVTDKHGMQYMLVKRGRKEVTPITPKDTHKPIDTVNKKLWSLVSNNDGQLSFFPNAGTASDPATIYVSLTFMENDKNINLSHNLTKFDKRVIEAVDALRRAGNLLMTDAMIYKRMGGSKYPKPEQLEKVAASMEKLMNTQIIINNAHSGSDAEYKVRERAQKLHYKGMMLQIAVMSYVPSDPAYSDSVEIGNVREPLFVRGQEVHRWYEVPIEPLIMRYSRERGNVYAIPQDIHEDSGLSLTEENIALEDFVLERIYRHGASKTIIWATLFEECMIARRDHGNCRRKVEKLLTSLKLKGVISGYKISEEKIVLTPAKPTKKIDKK